MSAYLVFIKEREHDKDKLASYGASVGATLAGHSVKPLVLYGATETLEGPEALTTVILEFPTRDEARAWYQSDAYQAVRADRFAGADFRVLLTQGV